jgi:hypothetical protein
VQAVKEKVCHSRLIADVGGIPALEQQQGPESSATVQKEKAVTG